MKIKTLVIFMTLLLAFTFKFDVADANTFKEVKIINSSTKVYEKPDSNSKVLGNVEKGTFVTLISENHNVSFSRITYLTSDDKIIDGYINGSALEDAQYTIKIASSKSGLVVKETPSLKGKTVATLQHKMVVKDFGSVRDGLSLVQYGNVIGYAATNFMSNTKPTTKYVVSSNLVVRNIASPSGMNVGELYKNEEVSVHSTIAGWSYVTTSSSEGYVVDSNLSSKNPNATTSSKPSSSSNTNTSNGSKSTYKNCTELRKDYPNGVDSSHPAYAKKHDRDGDGWACER
ncbi:excalibur calcium-binding domain-containing protein [Lysinibacillus parviboronicapiens]|uniref:excalibur calcium-binding domain-containing protein n=1 Tax=Lysinibacillus parviboronicapiens TaxID=436516 RepID=UPI00187D610B|nr:excalibur calcium-binding domain-containing protein [Lysinibacillus parviboronicapiens]